MFPQSDPTTEDPYLNLCDLFVETNEVQRQTMRNGWPFGRMWRIPHPGMVLDRPDGPITERRLLGMMLADALQAGMPDFRDILVGLPISYWLAEQLGLDADALFRRVAALSMPEIGEVILGFLERRDKSPEDMGWVAMATPNGRRWKFPH